MGGIFMMANIMTALKFCLSCLGILAVIYIFLELTPKIAKKVDSIYDNYRKKHPKSPEDERLYLVRSPFDGTHKIDMDKIKEQEKERQKLSEKSNEQNDNNLDSIGDVKNNG